MRITNVRLIGDIVRLKRHDNGWTQAQLANRAGVGRRFVSELEGGKSSVQFGLVLQVLDSLGLPLDVPNSAEHQADRQASHNARGTDSAFDLQGYVASFGDVQDDE